MQKAGLLRFLRWVAVATSLVTACENDRKTEDCQVSDATSCRAGLVCEQVGTTGTSCLAPVVVSGRVFDAVGGTSIIGATVVGLDSNGAARTRVAFTGPDGRYALPVSVPRNDDETPMTEAITLRVAGADHQAFATAPRSALPIDLGLAQASSGTYSLSNAATDVALLPLPVAERGGATIRGKVSAPAPSGVLVIAVAGERASSSAISDADGAFVLFNVKAGDVRLEGYRSGLSLEPKALQVPTSGLTDVTLVASSVPLARVEGSVNIVNAAGGLTTSVILAVASTFDSKVIRGEAPAGLRVNNVSGAFRIEGVPAGRYAVLAAYENDLLVRDPDLSISGTDIVFVDVGASGGMVSLPTSFKVTGALDIVSPGASGLEPVPAGVNNLIWNDDSSEDGYELRVYDGLGNVVHEDRQVARVTGSTTVQYALDTTSFVSGMLYQFRVVSFRERQGGRTYISASEDLKGVFQTTR